MSCLMFKLFLFLTFASSVLSDDFRRRHEYKFSFKGPSLTKGSYQIPFWAINGDAVPGSDQVRLVPSLRDKSGGIWSKYNFPKEDWQVEVHFRIHGRGRIGADGMVVWLAEKPNETGPVFGYMNQWKGLGIFIDSYDNDGSKNNPMIAVILNDGTKTYKHELDGSDTKLDSCMRDIRNRIFPSKLRVTYWKKTLKVEIDPGNSNSADYEQCAHVEGIDIPKDYYFGITAATGGLADDHDVISFTTHSLYEDQPAVEGEKAVSDEEAAKKAEEEKKVQEEEESYKKKMDEFETEARKFREQHPDLVKTQMPDPNSIEEATSPEMRSILDVQSQIKIMMTSALKVMGNMMKKQEEMIPKIEETIKSNQASTTAGDGGSPSIGTDYASKTDISNVVEALKTTADVIDQLKSNINHISEQANSLSQELQQLDNRVNGYAMMKTGNEADAKTREQLDYLASLVLDVQAKQKQQSSTVPKLSCPPPPPTSCLSVGVFVFIAFIQIVVILGYQMISAMYVDHRKPYYYRV